jgi:hypothetical protein
MDCLRNIKSIFHRQGNSAEPSFAQNLILGVERYRHRYKGQLIVWHGIEMVGVPAGAPPVAAGL